MSVTYNEALKIARTVKSRIMHCTEYTNAFSFDSGDTTDGGDSPVVVMKSDGSIMDMISYAITPCKEIIRDFTVETKFDK